MKIISWNVNGIRSVMSKHKLSELIQKHDPDILCLQEIRCSQSFDFDQKITTLHPEFTYIYKNCAQKRGYSGTCILSKVKPKQVILGDDIEGRLITAEFEKFIVICMYVPNSKPDLSRLDERVNVWEPSIRKHVLSLQQNAKRQKPIILSGDFNVAPEPIDLHNPKQSEGKHGYTKQERQAFQELLRQCNMLDAFRFLHPNEIGYTWFSNFAKSRERNKGWRIDHFLISTALKECIQSAEILNNMTGSDHVPISLEIKCSP